MKLDFPLSSPDVCRGAVDFVAVVMPPDTAMAFRTTQVKAYAYPDKKRSIFRSNRASEVSVQVHEFGHNNGLSHSGTVADTYGDRYVQPERKARFHQLTISLLCSVSKLTRMPLLFCRQPRCLPSSFAIIVIHEQHMHDGRSDVVGRWSEDMLQCSKE